MITNEFLAKLLTNAPWWVWLALLVILYRGFLASNTRAVWLPNLFIMPSIMLALGVKNLINVELFVLLFYLLAFFLANSIGFSLGNKEKIQVLKNKLTIILPGTWQVLYILLFFFATKFFFGFLKATNPPQAKNFLWLELALSGSLSGYFFGRALGYTKQFLQNDR
jgi:hypothetical protein